MAKKVKELTANEAEEIADKVCDTMNATLKDIYEKIEVQAKMGRMGMHYKAFLTGDKEYTKIRNILMKKGYLVNRLGNLDCIYSFNIFWHGMPF